jgi:hypothetical protein
MLSDGRLFGKAGMIQLWALFTLQARQRVSLSPFFQVSFHRQPLETLTRLAWSSLSEHPTMGNFFSPRLVAKNDAEIIYQPQGNGFPHPPYILGSLE